MRLIVAITGASGIIYGKRLLEELQNRSIETHLIISRAAERVIESELETPKGEIESFATYVYGADDLCAPLVSGSFKTDGMVIIPCSMKTLAGIAHGYSSNLILRAADVTLKERRKLVLVPRETPLSVVHLKNMLELAGQGVVILPAMPAFYHRPKDVEAMVNYVIGKVLDTLGLEHKLFKRWSDN